MSGDCAWPLGPGTYDKGGVHDIGVVVHTP